MDFVADFAQQYAALFVSICALLLTINQAVMTRKHNRLTVRPHLTSFTDNVPHPSFGGISLIKMSLSNNGIGPAVVKSFQPMLDGVPLDPENFDELLSIAKRELPVSLLDQGCRFSLFRKGYVMAKDESMSVAEIAYAPTIHDDPKALEAALQRFHLKVDYESIYEEKFSYDSRNHF